MLGIDFGALDMMPNLAISYITDAYESIYDNVGRIVKISELREHEINFWNCLTRISC